MVFIVGNFHKAFDTYQFSRQVIKFNPISIKTNKINVSETGPFIDHYEYNAI